MPNTLRWSRLLLLLMVATGLVACGGEEPPTATTSPPSATPLPPTATPVPPTATPVPPTPTAIPPTATPPPTAPPAAVLDLATFVRFETADGVSFAYPPDWLLSDDFFPIVATHENLLDGGDAGEEGAFLGLFSAGAGEAGLSATELINQFVAETLEPEDDTVILSGPTALTINGLPAARIVLRGPATDEDRLIIFVVTAVLGETTIAYTIGSTPDDSFALYEETLDAIAASISINTAPLVVVDGGAVDGFVTHDNPAASIRFSHPQEWFLTTDGSLFTLTLDEAAAASEEFAGGAGLFIFVDDAIIGLSPTNLIPLFVEQLRLFDDAVIVSAAVPLQLNGQAAARAVYTASIDDVNVEVTYTALQGVDNSAIVVAIREEDTPYGETLLAIANSILLSPPDPSAATDDGLPAATTRPIDVATVYDTTLTENATDEYIYDATAGAPFVVIVDSYDDLDVMLELWQGGTLLAEIDDAFSDESEALVYTAAVDGEIVIRVTGFLGDDGGYTIGLLRLDAGAEVLLTDGDTVPDNGSIDYTLTAVVGEALLIAADPDENFDVALTIYDAEGNLVVERDDLSGTSGVLETHIFRPPAAGDYTLSITGFAGLGGDYALTIGAANIAP